LRIGVKERRPCTPAVKGETQWDGAKVLRLVSKRETIWNDWGEREYGREGDRNLGVSVRFEDEPR
jgi:hypothetical protein